MKYNFGYPEKLVALQWDSLYLEWIPKVLAAGTTADYYGQLTLLCVHLGDGHTNVYLSKELDTSKPPLRTQLVEGRVLITEVMSPALAGRGLRAGTEIVKIDGVPVFEYARPLIARQCSSTPQDRQLCTFTYVLLRGAKNQPVRLPLRSPDGREQDYTLERSGYTDTTSVPPFAWRKLPGNIAYVSLTTFENNAPAAAFAEALPQFREAAGLIIDLRWNGGGSTSVGYAILSRLLTKPTFDARQVMRRYNPMERARGTLMDWLEEPAGELAPRTDPHYHGPAVVLTRAATFSAAEDFLVSWRTAARGAILGETSGGSTGQPLLFQLPGGGGARVCTKRDTVLEHAANLLRNSR